MLAQASTAPIDNLGADRAPVINSVADKEIAKNNKYCKARHACIELNILAGFLLDHSLDSV